MNGISSDLEADFDIEQKLAGLVRGNTPCKNLIVDENLKKIYEQKLKDKRSRSASDREDFCREVEKKRFYEIINVLVSTPVICTIYNFVLTIFDIPVIFRVPMLIGAIISILYMAKISLDTQRQDAEKKLREIEEIIANGKYTGIELSFCEAKKYIESSSNKIERYVDIVDVDKAATVRHHTFYDIEWLCGKPEF